jgi:tol-pal system protein YbgF
VGIFLKKLNLKKTLKQSSHFQNLLFCGLILTLAACAPASTGLAPSGAMQQQLSMIREQQQDQSRLVQQLQEQLTQMQQQLSSAGIITMPQPTLEIPDAVTTPEVATIIPPRQPEQLPQYLSGAQEVSVVAASASSYLAAFSDLAAGRWSLAESGFQKFLDNFKDHQYTANARYWLANAQLSQGKTDTATINLQQIITDPRGQAKAPAAMLQLEQLYRSQGWTKQADKLAEQLRTHYPDSQEAQYLYQNSEPN